MQHASWKKAAAALGLSLALLAGCTPAAPAGPGPASSAGSASQTAQTSSRQTSSAVPETRRATLSFGGDVLIHTQLFRSAEQEDGSYDFTEFVADMEGFFDSDFNMLNIEVPIDAKGNNEGISTYPQFNAPYEVMDMVRRLGVETVTHVNNHSYDQGYKGFVRSVENLREKFDVLGVYLSEEEYNEPCIREINGIKVGILAYTDHVNGYSASRLEPYSLRLFELSMDGVPAILSDVQALRDAGAEYIIVSLHWGSEYVDKPSSTQQKVAHALTDAGVDLIVGGHSHCVQPIEKRTVTYNGQQKETLILYSLGNFFADQASLQHKRDPSYVKTQQGMKVTITLEKDGGTGQVRLADACYVPTVMIRNKIKSPWIWEYHMIPAGEYALADEMPALFKDAAQWQEAKDAWERVCSVVGDDIRAEAS